MTANPVSGRTGGPPGQMFIHRIHRIQCACAAATGCTSDLVWQDHLDSARYPNETLLTLNGWRKDYGEWVCRNHPVTAAPCMAGRTDVILAVTPPWDDGWPAGNRLSVYEDRP